MPSSCHCNTLRLAARRLSATYDAALAPLGINIAQYALLRVVAHRQPVSLTTLGQLQGLDRSTVGRNVRVLERLGALATGRNDQDQREAVVRLTESGADLLAKAHPLWAACQSAVETKVGADKLRAVVDVLDLL
ncbi:MarR family winged helix-turn-helix transcriptional regulator [Xanthobacter sp. V4C-4]|uniref:MarR family winged helix-turn-helix transcriptional regulator n=1 Tax=Xanthobacter cornucopiae TaxID=3119924 RepID=UPI003729D820